MARTRNILATIALCAALFFLSLTTSDAHIRKLTQTFPIIPVTKKPLYVFGDSLYDTGTGFYAGIGPAAKFYPYGIDTVNKTPNGRFSDGDLIPDFIAVYAGLAKPEPYLRPGFSNYTEAVNFADCSSAVLPESRPGTLDLKMQTNNFVQMVGKLNAQYGATQTRDLLSRGVYVFNTGANDVVDLYRSYFYKNQALPASVLNTLLTKMMGNISMNIDTMYNQGGRKFAFNYAAPMGCLPGFLLWNGSCSGDLNSVSRTFNDAIKSLFQSKATQLPGFKYSLYDFYTALYERKTNGLLYGFTETQSACCGNGPFFGDFSCMDPDRTKYRYCGHPIDYLWFDSGHPTQKANELFAKDFWSGDTNTVAAPNNLMGLFQL